MVSTTSDKPPAWKLTSISRSSSLTLGLGILLIIAIVIIAVVSAFILRNSEIAVWKKQLSNLSLILSEHASQTMSSSYAVLDGITEKVRSMNIHSASDLRIRARDPQVFRMLRDKVASLSHIEVATIVADNGDVINFTRSNPPTSINLSDRDYYQTHLSSPDAGNFISTPVRNKGNGKWTFYLSRRLNDSRGRMIGLVLLGISVDAFSGFYKNVADNLGEGATICLYRNDFVLLTHYPEADSMIGKTNRSGAVSRIVGTQHKKDDIVYTTAPRFIDGAAAGRLVAVRSVDRYPLIVTAAINDDLFLGNWSNTVKVLTGVTTGCVLTLAGLLIVFVRVQRSREKEMDRNIELSDTLNRISHRNELLLNCTGEGILGVDLEGNHTFANPAASWMLGYTVEELMDKHSHSLWHHTKPDGSPYPEEECPIYAATKTGTINHVRNEIFWRKDGTSFPVSYTSTPVIDSGLIVGAVLTFRDISDLRRADETVRESGSRLRTILNTVQAGILLIDAETHSIVDLNPAAARLIGQPMEEIIGSICHNFICPAEEGKCPITDLGQTVDNSERVLLSREGRRIPIIKTVVSIMLGGRRHILESFVDVSEQKKLERQLLQAQKMDAIGHLAGGIAHDFNNLLSTIMGAAHLCLIKIGPDDGVRGEIDQILETTERAAELIRGLLAFARKQTVDLQVHDVNEIIGGFQKILMRLSREDIEFTTVFSNQPLPIMADRGQIEQIIMNLVANARDAISAEGRITIKTSRISIDENFVSLHGYGTVDDYACISVSDNGQGMDEATRRRIFEPFFTTKEPGKGTGLGMATAYGIVKKHNGYINVMSEEGKGTTFNIYFPITKVASQVKENGKDLIEPAERGHETILVAEDDNALRKLTETVLKHFGYKVISVGDGEEACRTFDANRHGIDLVILDGIMPRKNGKEAYEAIRIMRPDIKAIFISGYADDILTREGVTTTKVPHLLKPVSPAELLRKVRHILDQNHEL